MTLGDPPLGVLQRCLDATIGQCRERGQRGVEVVDAGQVAPGDRHENSISILPQRLAKALAGVNSGRLGHDAMAAALQQALLPKRLKRARIRCNPVFNEATARYDSRLLPGLHTMLVRHRGHIPESLSLIKTQSLRSTLQQHGLYCEAHASPPEHRFKGRLSCDAIANVITTGHRRDNFLVLQKTKQARTAGTIEAIDDSMTRSDLAVVMTTFNRSHLLTQTLESLSRANTEGLEWTLIVVDNASTDDTRKVLDRFSCCLPMTVCHEPERGYAKAKNHGLSRANADLIVFTDDDVIVDYEWFQQLRAGARRWPQASIFGGRVDALLPADTPRWLRETDARNRVKRMFAQYEPEAAEGPTVRPPVGVNICFRAAAIGDSRLDENRGADGSDNYLQSAEIDFIRRLVANGHEIVYLPAARVQHVVLAEQLTSKRLKARAYRRGRNSAVRDTDRYARRSIVGAPLRLWFEVTKLTVRVGILWPLGKARRFRIEDKLAFRWGALYQLRLANKQRKT